MKKAIALFCAALLVCALAGCGGGGGPEETVTAFFEAAKTIDIEKMNACLSPDQALVWDLETQSDDENAQSLMQLLRSLAAKLDYTLDNCTRSGDAATADVTVQYTDASMTVKDALTDVMADLFATLFGIQSETDPEKLLLQAVQEKVEAGETAARTAQLRLQLENGEDGWRITDLPEQMITLMTGNAIDAVEDAVQTLTEKTE